MSLKQQNHELLINSFMQHSWFFLFLKKTKRHKKTKKTFPIPLLGFIICTAVPGRGSSELEEKTDGRTDPITWNRNDPVRNIQDLAKHVNCLHTEFSVSGLSCLFVNHSDGKQKGNYPAWGEQNLNRS